MGSNRLRSALERVAHGVGAFVLADLVVGLAASATISLAALWFASVGWIWAVGRYNAAGLSFGEPWQLGLAWVGTFSCIPMMGVVLTLARASFRIPTAWFQRACGGARSTRWVWTAPPRAVVRLER